MNLTPAQSQIVSDTHRFRVVNCGRRFGKTTLAVWEMLACAVYQTNRNICYIAPTYQQARDIAWQELKRVCQPVTNKVNESRLEITINCKGGGTSNILLRGWEAVETLRGQKFDFVVIDEIASMRNWLNNWQEVIRPTLTDTKGQALFISTPKGFNHFYELYNLENTDSDYKSFHFSSHDNPHLPPDELEKARQELTEDRFAQEYLADFRKTEGLVYKEFDRTKHIYSSDEKLPNYIKFGVVNTAVGVDFGYTNPTAILKVQQDGDAKYFVSEEFYKTNKTTLEIVEVARSFNGNYYYPDPAEPDRIAELKRAGLNIMEVSKDVEAGIQAVRDLFKAGRLFINANCVNLIWELETYSYPEKKPGHNEYEAPIKENDHALDALRYVLYMHAQQKGGYAYVHYAPSSQPVHNTPGGAIAPGSPIRPKQAYVHIPKLRWTNWPNL